MPDNLKETAASLMWSDMDSELEEETTEEVEDIESVDEGEESEEVEEIEEDESETIEFNGREISAQELEEMQKAFDDRKNFQADYTRKTTALSQEMKRAQTFTEKQEQLTTSLEEMLEVFEESINSEEKSINWDELDEDDPGEARKLERKFEKRRKEAEEARSKVKAARKQAEEARLAKEQELILELIPEWFDGGKPSEAQQEEYPIVYQYLVDLGYSQDEIGEISSARQWAAYRDAAKYAALQKKKPQQKKLVKKKPKTVKGGKTPKPGSKNKAWDQVFYGDSMK